MDLIVENIGELVTGRGFKEKDGRHPQEADLGIVKKASLLVLGGRVKFAGPQSQLQKFISRSDLPSQKKKRIKILDAQARTVIPGFVEGHTHLVFSGDRKKEFELRNRGASYQEISESGGGIKQTVAETRKTSLKKLLEISQARVDRFIRQGVTTIEAKSGYGLDSASETKICQAHRKLEGCRLISTFLGLHSLPPEFVGRRREFVQSMLTLLPELNKKKLVDRVDVFIEKGFFDCEDARLLFAIGKDLGLTLTAHTEQLSYTGGFLEVIKMSGSSADHLVEIREDEVRALANSQTVAMLLPTSDFYLKIKYPPARKLIDQGCAVALSTDFNSGTSPTQDLSLVGVLARLEMKMTLAEVFCAYTYNASKALGIHSSTGVLLEGAVADFAIAEANWDDFFYQVGHHPIVSTHFSGISLP